MDLWFVPGHSCVYTRSKSGLASVIVIQTRTASDPTSLACTLKHQERLDCTPTGRLPFLKPCSSHPPDQSPDLAYWIFPSCLYNSIKPEAIFIQKCSSTSWAARYFAGLFDLGKQVLKLWNSTKINRKTMGMGQLVISV